jgi:hypothetical protein
VLSDGELLSTSLGQVGWEPLLGEVKEINAVALMTDL